MRKVIWQDYRKRQGERDTPAIWHQWGCNYEEFDSGPGNYSTAIIELPDGTIKNVPADDIRFLDKPNQR